METITIFTHGGSQGNPGPAGIGVIIIDGQGKTVKELGETIGNATNNFAEYQAVMRGLQIAKELFGEKTKTMQFECKLESEFVKKQLNDESLINEPGLVPYFIEIHNMRVSSFPNLTFTQVGRENNVDANQLVNEVLDR